MKRSLSIVGAGRVGRALGERLREAGWKIGAVVARSKSSARKAVRFIGAGQPHGTIGREAANSQVVLISTPDDQIRDAAETLAAVCGETLRGKIVLHTSGTHDANILQAAKKYGASVGSLHPMQSFSGIKAPLLKEIVFAIEGDAQAMTAAKKIVKGLGGRCRHVSEGKTALNHAAGVMAAGHTLALMEAATMMLMASGMKRKEAVRALLPLTRQVLDNFEMSGPKAAWTGPLARGDYEVVRAHREALRKLPEEFGGVYEALNRLTARVLAENPAAMMDELGAANKNRTSV